jgi:hypothetical protein
LRNYNGGKQYVPKQMKHSINPMKQSCRRTGEIRSTSGEIGHKMMQEA